MRIWLDPEKMRARALVPQDVIQALQQQSEQVTAGQIGMPPAPAGEAFQYTLNVAGKLSDPAEFAEVIVKTGRAGEVTRLRDVGRVELGAQTYGQVFTLDGKPAAGLAVFQAPGANALDVAGKLRRRLYRAQGLERARQGRGAALAVQDAERFACCDRGSRHPGVAAAADPRGRQRCRLHHADRAARWQLRSCQAAKRHQCDRHQR
jgi:hypothetical protein